MSDAKHDVAQQACNAAFRLSMWVAALGKVIILT